MDNNHKLFVASLPYAATDDDLHAHFAQVGEVISARVARDRDTHRSKGIGFVEMASEALAAEAIACLNDSELGGRRILVQVSRPKERRPAPGPRGRW
jgi:RNA recognition motif-containing protein